MINMGKCIEQNITRENVYLNEGKQMDDLLTDPTKQEKEKPCAKRVKFEQDYSLNKNVISRDKTQIASQMVAHSNRSDRTFNSSAIQLGSHVKPKIITGPSDETVSSPWMVKSQFDDLVFKIVPMTKAMKEPRQLLNKIRQIRSIPEMSLYIKDNGFVGAVQCSSRRATQDAFLKSRLSTLRKSPARLVLPKIVVTTETEIESLTTADESMSDLIAFTTRIDEVHHESIRFDPYHSECGPNCRRQFFLKKTLPHLAPKLTKIAKISEMPKTQKKKSNSDYI